MNLKPLLIIDKSFMNKKMYWYFVANLPYKIALNPYYLKNFNKGINLILIKILV